MFTREHTHTRTQLSRLQLDCVILVVANVVPYRHLVTSRALLSKIAHNSRRVWLWLWLQLWLWLCRCFEFFLSSNSILKRCRDILDALGCAVVFNRAGIIVALVCCLYWNQAVDLRDARFRVQDSLPSSSD